MLNWKKGVASLVVGVGLVGLGFWFGNVSAAGNEPGSEADPLVSKSYVDGRSSFQVVNLAVGATFVAEGGTEIVQRAGKTTAVVSPQGGLLDVTGGTDLVQGEVVKPNHLLVIPRTDGRGLLAKADSILMVKGNYTIRLAGQ
jgi:hypothetical protein